MTDSAAACGRIDDPAVRAEVAAVFARYEDALAANDTATLDALFWQDARTVRYGIAETQYGHAAIAAFRTAQPPDVANRVLHETVITTFGRDCATVSTLFRGAPGRVGRQMQTWVRFAEGWRVVAAHVSVIGEPAPQP